MEASGIVIKESGEYRVYPIPYVFPVFLSEIELPGLILAVLNPMIQGQFHESGSFPWSFEAKDKPYNEDCVLL